LEVVAEKTVRSAEVPHLLVASADVVKGRRFYPDDPDRHLDAKGHVGPRPMSGLERSDTRVKEASELVRGDDQNTDSSD
jgi:hypothetical protein